MNWIRQKDYNFIQGTGSDMKIAIGPGNLISVKKIIVEFWELVQAGRLL
jgi:hypothetical protein